MPADVGGCHAKFRAPRHGGKHPFLAFVFSSPQPGWTWGESQQAIHLVLFARFVLSSQACRGEVTYRLTSETRKALKLEDSCLRGAFSCSLVRHSVQGMCNLGVPRGCNM